MDIGEGKGEEKGKGMKDKAEGRGKCDFCRAVALY